jgi:hypothetical protein
MYLWREEDEAFRAQWDKARDLGADALEDELMRRAKNGTLKPIYQGGHLVGRVREYSNTLGIFLLKGAKPEKYRDNVHVRSETISLDKLFERMTPAELENYGKTGKLPAHLNVERVEE